MILLFQGSRADWGIMDNIEKALIKRGMDVWMQRMFWYMRPFDAQQALMAMGNILNSLNSIFVRHYDCIVLAGDRYETFCAAAAATIYNIPIVHVHGGEVTEGANDDVFRNAITKMSHLHFTANETYRQNVIRMGENPKTVFAVGAPGLDGLSSTKPTMKICDILITFHPVTRENNSEEQFRELLAALPKDKRILFTGSNSDVGGIQIDKMIDEYCGENGTLQRDMPRDEYLYALSGADMMIGNSSSGIIEAPVLHTPSIDIGNRQKGRMRGDSVIHCEATREDIKTAIDYVYSGFKPKFTNLYGDGHASARIANILSQWEFTKEKVAV